ncbi:hypothetical protein PMIN07_005740 [Paraphaeosphaeria minitans]
MLNTAAGSDPLCNARRAFACIQSDACCGLRTSPLPTRSTIRQSASPEMSAWAATRTQNMQRTLNIRMIMLERPYAAPGTTSEATQRLPFTGRAPSSPGKVDELLVVEGLHA